MSEIENEAEELGVYCVPEVNLAIMSAKIEKLNRRAKRVGAPPVGCAIEFLEVRFEVCDRSGTYWYSAETIEDLRSKGMKVPQTGNKMGFYSVKVSGSTPKFAGWTFVATLEAVDTKDGKVNLLKTVPGQSCPADYLDSIGHCDHCQKFRKRSATFVVKHESGEHKVVGRSCIADFLGGADPKKIASWAEFLISVDNEISEFENCSFGGSGSRGEILEELLAMTAAVIAKLGWVSKSASEFSGVSTASTVSQLLNPHPREPKEITCLREEISVSDEDKATAAAAIEWALSNDDPGNSYLTNLKTIANCEWVASKNVGLAVSMVAAYQRAFEKLKMAERRAAKPESNHVGAIKERLTLNVVCEAIYVTEGDYGSTGIHKLVDDAGNELTWFASGSASWLSREGKYAVKATVVEHDEYRGRKQTVVNRVKVVEELDEDWKPKASQEVEELDEEEGVAF